MLGNGLGLGIAAQESMQGLSGHSVKLAGRVGIGLRDNTEEGDSQQQGKFDKIHCAWFSRQKIRRATQNSGNAD
jgi:hypothetical protein